MTSIRETRAVLQIERRKGVAGQRLAERADLEIAAAEPLPVGGAHARLARADGDSLRVSDTPSSSSRSSFAMPCTNVTLTRGPRVADDDERSEAALARAHHDALAEAGRQRRPASCRAPRRRWHARARPPGPAGRRAVATTRSGQASAARRRHVDRPAERHERGLLDGLAERRVRGDRVADRLDGRLALDPDHAGVDQLGGLGADDDHAEQLAVLALAR